MNLDINNSQKKRKWTVYGTVLVLTSIATLVVSWLLITIFEHKEEAKNPYLKLVNVSEETTDPQYWGMNWAREYDGYKRTVEPSKTNFGGGDAVTPHEKAETYPWLTRMFAGYAFSLDYRDRRGHAYMLLDQEKTRRVTEKPQTGACLHCHTSVMPTYRRLGDGNTDWEKIVSGFSKLGAMPYQLAHEEVVKTGSNNPMTGGGAQKFEHEEGSHPVSCVDCHDPKSMQLRVTRPGFILGIQALANSNEPVPHLPSIEQWRKGDRHEAYNPNVDASRQEMRSYVCGQCHVEYYCGPKTTLFFPWNNGLKVEEIESMYDQYKFPDGHRFFDWKHQETGAELLKAQHPEFETWSQGIHARSGVACADCHMPYLREGAMKVSDHWVRSPLLMINRSCQTCHPYDESQLKARVATIQNRNFELLQRSGAALTDLLNAINQAKKDGASDAQIHDAQELQRKAQWRLDFVAAENSMGFHAPQESARILGESIDYARQGQILATQWQKNTQ
ncbi:MAG: ammonia-forming cytochrome c nitrite reductase subunit c552 [Deltaproteobacteria bacterium]|nr:MAG: ammonia-forming cytochrome c nitrite reductase subunit c552 [Deltaproteobacteria bacterium]